MAYTTYDGLITITTKKGTVKSFLPADLKIDYDSLATSDSGRDDDGYMHIDWILQRARKLNITLPPMFKHDVGEILDLVMGQVYKITFRDAITDAAMTIDVYTSKTNATLYSGTISDGIWTGCTFSAIEMGGESGIER